MDSATFATDETDASQKSDTPEAPDKSPLVKSSLAISEASQKQDGLRKRVVEEILSTERTYVDNLRYLLSEYLSPLTQMAKENPDAAVKELTPSFSGISAICKLHEDLLQQLQARMVDWQSDTSKVGDVLLNIAPYLKVYTAYVNNYEETLKSLGRLQQSKKFSAFFQSRKAPNDDVRGDWYMSHLLILPVQRIPRYELLLKELIKQTPDTHMDHADITEAQLVISKTARHVNDTKTQLENRQRMWHLHGKLQWDDQAKKRDKLVSLVKPTRVIVKEGTVKKMIRGKESPCLVVLFNDSLLLAEIADEQEEQLKFLAMISLFESTVRSIGPVSIPSSLRDSTRSAATALQDFHLNQVLVRSKEGVIVTFYATDDSEMRQWSADIDSQSKLYTASKRQYAESMPMAQACKANDATTLRALLSAQPTAVNVPDAKGRTLLYFAAKKGHMEIVKILAEEFGADSSQYTDQRYSPIEIAKVSGFVAIANLLESLKAAKEPRAVEEERDKGGERKKEKEERKERKGKDREERKERKEKDKEEKIKEKKEKMKEKMKDKEETKTKSKEREEDRKTVARRKSLLDTTKIAAQLKIAALAQARDKIERLVKDKPSAPVPSDEHFLFTRSLPSELQKALRSRNITAPIPKVTQSAPTRGPLSSSSLISPRSPSSPSSPSRARLSASPSSSFSSPSPPVSPRSPKPASSSINTRELDTLSARLMAGSSSVVSAYATLKMAKRHKRPDLGQVFVSPPPASSASSPSSSPSASSSSSLSPTSSVAAAATEQPPIIVTTDAGENLTLLKEPVNKKKLRLSVGQLALFKRAGGPPPPEALLARSVLFTRLAAKKEEVARYKALLKQAEEEREQIETQIIEQYPKGPSKKASIIHNYLARYKGELEGSVGDTLTVEMNESDYDQIWYLGKMNGQMGLIQGIYLEIADVTEPIFTPRGVADVITATAEQPTEAGHAKVAFEYQAQRDDELSLNVDEIITIHRRSDSGWWEGTIVSTQLRGLFPCNYVVEF